MLLSPARDDHVGLYTNNKHCGCLLAQIKQFPKDRIDALKLRSHTDGLREPFEGCCICKASIPYRIDSGGGLFVVLAVRVHPNRQDRSTTDAGLVLLHDLVVTSHDLVHEATVAA